MLSDDAQVLVPLTAGDVRQLAKMCERWRRYSHDVEYEAYLLSLGYRLILSLAEPVPGAVNARGETP